MRLLTSPTVALLCMFASKVATQTIGEMVHVVDHRTLKTCYSKADCLGWQVCASCIHTVPSVVAKYCSDFTYRGICGYRDAEFFCTCDEGSLDKPQAQRDGMKRLMDIATTQGGCILDSDCDKFFPGKNYRCGTCLREGGEVSNLCTDPSAGAGSTCDPSSSFSSRCSCGQLYPEPKRIWPPNERERFIHEQKLGDAGNYLAQPVAAATEIDFTGFKDQTVDSGQAGPGIAFGDDAFGDDDWTV